MNRVPVGPIAVSLALIVAGGVYYAVALRDDGPSPSADGVLRVVVWNVGWESGIAGAETIAGVLRQAHADIVALVGASDSEQADRVMAALAGEWHVAAVPADAANASYLVLLAADGLGQIDQYLVEAGCSRAAIAFDISDSRWGRWRFVCCDSGEDEPDCAQRYVDDVVAWCEGKPAVLTMLAGRLGADGAGKRVDEPTARLPATYAQVHAPDESHAGGCTVHVTGTARASTRPLATLDATCPEHEPVFIEIAQ